MLGAKSLKSFKQDTRVAKITNTVYKFMNLMSLQMCVHNWLSKLKACFMI